MDDRDELKQIMREVVREELAAFLGSSQYQFQKDAKFYDARNIQLGYTTGTMIATDASQKLGFFGTTPVSQYATPFNSNASAVYGATEQGIINGLKAALLSYGIIHS